MDLCMCVFLHHSGVGLDEAYSSHQKSQSALHCIIPLSEGRKITWTVTKLENIAGRESKSKVLGKKEMRWALFCLLACLLVGSDTPFLGSQL